MFIFVAVECLKKHQFAEFGNFFLVGNICCSLLLQSSLPFCLREVWVITACVALIDSTTSNYDGGIVTPDAEKEFYRLQGDLYSLARVKVKS